MHVPCYRLPMFSRYLKKVGLAERRETAKSYWEVLRRATSRPDDEDGPGTIVHDGRKRLKGTFTDGFSETPDIHRSA